MSTQTGWAGVEPAWPVITRAGVETADDFENLFTAQVQALSIEQADRVPGIEQRSADREQSQRDLMANDAPRA